MSSPAQAVVALDVSDLDVSCRFYEAALGFTVSRADRAGQIHASRLLTSPRFPGFALHLREGFGKRVGGSQPGGMLRLSLRTADVAGAAAAALAAGARPAAVPVPTAASPGTSARVLDPDGYQVELFTELAGLV